MPIPFPLYAKIKNNYAICYFGKCTEYLIQLKYIRPLIEKKYPGIKIYLGCRDDVVHILNTERGIIKESEMRNKKMYFAYIHEVKCNTQDHPILEIINENEIELPEIKLIDNDSNLCLIYSHGMFPTKSLTDEQVEKTKKTYEMKGLTVKVNIDNQTAGHVIGVENQQLFSAGFSGKKVTLIPTGVGKELFLKLFKNNGDILNIL